MGVILPFINKVSPIPFQTTTMDTKDLDKTSYHPLSKSYSQTVISAMRFKMGQD